MLRTIEIHELEVGKSPKCDFFEKKEKRERWKRNMVKSMN